MNETAAVKTVPLSLDNIRTRVLGADFYPFKPGQNVGPRLPYTHSFILIASGYGSMTIGGRMWRAQPNDLFAIQPGVEHAFAADAADPMVHASVYVDLASPSTAKQRGDKQLNTYSRSRFDAQMCAAVIQWEGAVTVPVQLAVPNGAAWIKPFFQIIESFPEQLAGTETLLRAYFESFFIPFFRFAQQTRSIADPRVTRWIRWMEETGPADSGTEQWASRFGISTAYLYELFHKQTGTGPQSYLLKLRVDKAKALLRETDLSVTVIAERLGFSSLHYFSRQFARQAGEPPTQYRSRFRGYD